MGWRAGIALIVATWVFFFFLTLSFDGFIRKLDTNFFIILGGTVLAGMILSVPVFLLINRSVHRSTGQRVAIAAASTIPAAAITTFLGFNMAMNWFPPAELLPHLDKIKARPDYPLAWLLTLFSQHLFLFALMAVLILAIGYAVQSRRAEQRAAALEIEAREAQLRALLYQVNPHFLFNTLNSLSALVLAGKNVMAERMILNLSTFLRSTLHANPTNDIRLSDEIALQNLYLDIEQTRFPNRLRLNMDVPGELEDVCVPVLILQPLIENAVKYGVAPSSNPCEVNISASEADGRLTLRVANDLPPTEAQSGTGVGLANVRDRLAARYNGTASADWGKGPDGRFTVTLSLPLIRNGC